MKKDNFSPTDAVISITYACNSRCIMCNIWKTDRSDDIHPKDYSRLPRSLKNINIVGGEPFLRKDLPSIIEVILRACNQPRIIISTNGLLTKHIRNTITCLISMTKKLAVRVSIDGMNEINDSIRGVKNSFRKVMSTIEVLSDAGVEDLGIGLTIQNRNLSQIKPIYDLSRRLKLECHITLAHNSEHYYFTRENESIKNLTLLREGVEYIKDQEYRSLNLKRWFRAYYAQILFTYACTGIGVSNCSTLKDFFYIDPVGMIFPCVLLNKPVGNLKEMSYDEICQSEGAQITMNIAKDCPVSCWMICSSAVFLKKHPLRYLPLIFFKMLQANIK